MKGAAVIELSTFVHDLRSELSEAALNAPDRGLQFELGEVELEVQVSFERSGGASGRVKFLVLEGDVDGSTTRGAVHTVRLHLRPYLTVDGRRTSAHISGQRGQYER